MPSDADNIGELDLGNQLPGEGLHTAPRPYKLDSVSLARLSFVGLKQVQKRNSSLTKFIKVSDCKSIKMVSIESSTK